MVDEEVVIIEVAGAVVAMVAETTKTTTTIMVVNLMVALITFLMQVVNRIKIAMEVHGLMGGFKYTNPLTGLLSRVFYLVHWLLHFSPALRFSPALVPNSL